MPRRKERSPTETFTEMRRVVQHGRSFYLSVPPEFLKRNGIVPGDKVAVIVSNHQLRAFIEDDKES